MVQIAYRWARRIVVAVIGFTVLGIGIAMMVLPGPAFVVIPIGLGILGLEFAWARRWLLTLKERAASLAASVTKSNQTAASGTAAGSDSRPR